MNLRGIAHSNHADREVVDLLFFPTGGGKTEAYLGLAAFTLMLRRLRNPGIASAGLSVLMRYTLRLLTLDQLSRAATLICALELERRKDEKNLGAWPFEIGLWVGKAARLTRWVVRGMAITARPAPRPSRSRMTAVSANAQPTILDLRHRQPLRKPAGRVPSFNRACGFAEEAGEGSRVE
jgi:hypothetical protein